MVCLGINYHQRQICEGKRPFTRYVSPLQIFSVIETPLVVSPLAPPCVRKRQGQSPTSFRHHVAPPSSTRSSKLALDAPLRCRTAFPIGLRHGTFHLLLFHLLYILYPIACSYTIYFGPYRSFPSFPRPALVVAAAKSLNQLAHTSFLMPCFCDWTVGWFVMENGHAGHFWSFSRMVIIRENTAARRSQPRTTDQHSKYIRTKQPLEHSHKYIPRAFGAANIEESDRSWARKCAPLIIT
jgi:hypothetical protein